MSVRNASTESVDGANVKVPDVPNPPTSASAADVGTGRAYGNGAASVTVTPDTSYWGSTITGYTVTASPGGATATGTSPVTVTGLSGNSSYTFTATANNGTGSSSSSAATASTPITTVPDVPTSVTATDQGSTRPYNSGQASVSFTPGNTGGKTVSTYTVTSSPGSFTNTGASSPIVLTGLQSATAYTYTVTATNANGTSSASSASGAVTATTVPQAPTIGTVSATNATTVSIPFTAGATGGSSITSYTTTSSPSISLSTSGTTTPLTVTGTFAANQAYTFQIAAVNANGNSTASSASNSVTPFITSFDSISTVTAAGGETTLTLSSIPQTYTHLQVRYAGLTNTTASAIRIAYNAFSSYAGHQMYGSNNSASASYSTAASYIGDFDLSLGGTSTSSLITGVGVIDIHNYSSTTQTKTTRVFSGIDRNGSGNVTLVSGFCYGTNGAISSLSFTTVSGAAFAAGTTFALYGIKGA